MNSKKYGTLILDESAKTYIDNLRRFHVRFLAKEPTNREIVNYYIKETIAVFVLATTNDRWKFKRAIEEYRNTDLYNNSMVIYDIAVGNYKVEYKRK